MSTREEMEEDARAERWERKRAQVFCSTCRQMGGHHSACPDNDEPDVTSEATDEIDDESEDDDTEEEV